MIRAFLFLSCCFHGAHRRGRERKRLFSPVTSALPVICEQSGDDRILFRQSVPALDLRQARQSGCLPVREDPPRYLSKLVMLRATIFESPKALWLREDGCDSSLLLQFPDREGIEPAAGFELEKDTNLSVLDDALNDFIPGTLKLKKQITATFVGRFDSVFAWRKGKLVRIREGYGHLGMAKRRLVLQRVSEIVLLDADPQRER